MSVATEITRLNGNLDSLSDAKTNIAAAITNKGGTVASGDGFADFATDITSIPSGGGLDLWQYVGSLNYAFSDVDMSDIDELVINAPNCKNFDHAFYRTVSEIHYPRKITINTNQKITSLWYAYYNQHASIPGTEEIILNSNGLASTKANAFYSPRDYNSLKRIELNVGDTSESTNMNIFTGLSLLEEIAGDSLNLSGVAQSGNLPNLHQCTALKTVRFVPNTVNVNWQFSSSFSTHLTDDTIISIANALNETVTGQTIKIISAVITKCQTIVGTVSLDPTNTFHVFTASAGGTSTLADFITNTKGWTLTTP